MNNHDLISRVRLWSNLNFKVIIPCLTVDENDIFSKIQIMKNILIDYYIFNDSQNKNWNLFNIKMKILSQLHITLMQSENKIESLTRELSKENIILLCDLSPSIRDLTIHLLKQIIEKITSLIRAEREKKAKILFNLEEAINTVESQKKYNEPENSSLLYCNDLEKPIEIKKKYTRKEESNKVTETEFVFEKC